MKKEDAISYLKIFGGLIIISPLIFAFFRLDYSTGNSFAITAVIYVALMALAISMYNYLQHGNFSYKAKYKNNNDK